jgi:hypothetical protein
MNRNAEDIPMNKRKPKPAGGAKRRPTDIAKISAKGP